MFRILHPGDPMWRLVTGEPTGWGLVPNLRFGTRPQPVGFLLKNRGRLVRLERPLYGPGVACEKPPPPRFAPILPPPV